MDACFRNAWYAAAWEGYAFWNSWRIPKVRHCPFIEAHFGEHEAINQLSELRWGSLASMILRISRCPPGGRPEDTGATMVNLRIITPETAGISHYFRTCAPDAENERLARAVFEQVEGPMLAVVQARMAATARHETAQLS